MKTTTFNISTKKNETQTLRWLIVQSIPYPDITTDCGGFKWRNGEGLFSSYGQPAKGLAPRYTCHLLTPDAVVDGDYNRTAFAGYKDYTTQAVSPGAIMYRGKSFDELSVTLSNNLDWPEIRTNCTEHPSSGEREMLIELVVPKLKEFIEQNKQDLYDSAVESIRRNFERKIFEARVAIDKLQAESLDIVSKLKNRKL